MPGSPRKRRGESPQTRAKPGATLRQWSAHVASEKSLDRVNERAEGYLLYLLRTARIGCPTQRNLIRASVVSLERSSSTQWRVPFNTTTVRSDATSFICCPSASW